VTREDGVLALSNSGEAAELADIVAYTRRFTIPLLAITSLSDSSLAKEADCVLELPQAEEACPLNLAPTTSTTMMMALGDALAVPLMRRTVFPTGVYRLFHPGGKLGKRLKLVHELMHSGAAVPLAEDGAGMSEVILIMTQKTFGCCGILDQGGAL